MANHKSGTPASKSIEACEDILANEDDFMDFQEWIWRIPEGVSQIYACPVYDWPVNRPMDTPDCDTRHGQVTLRLMQRQWPRYMFALIATFINFDEWWLESMIE